ncbi:hypothetical protein M011DRAFT_494446 [Sporormia fimetaria CBS 119925]|uniref:Reverse transcriptase domain-containing protein n=1 Tax=Sporormia fimetaria CBS 119925 TaxID=1340428 RepID=A0A6A6V9T4_9PLEO|nr:hypothetical protein M011DRAFT_494446 [Sporormia fimetaria CBS 119925]
MALTTMRATLHTITKTKLEELAKQRAIFDEECTALLSAASAEKDPLQRLRLLSHGAKACLRVKAVPMATTSSSQKGHSSPHEQLETDFRNLDRFLEQAHHDPSMSSSWAGILGTWEKTIRQYLSVQSSRYAYADLYGQMVTEWLSSENTGMPSRKRKADDSFEELPGNERLESRASWEKVVFESANIDVDALEAYLHKLFIADKKDVAKSIDLIRTKVAEFELRLARSEPFDIATLRWVIEGLGPSDLLSDSQREALKDFLSNDMILYEIGDVLNMRMATLDRWSWGEHVLVEQRRQLNGTYTMHLHEDLLQAMFLHYIGTKWSVFFKETLLAFRRASWKSNESTIPKATQQRREYYLGYRGLYKSQNLEQQQAQRNRQSYFAYQLMDHESQRFEVTEGEEEVDVAKLVLQTAPKYARTKQTARRSVSNAMPEGTGSGDRESRKTVPPKKPMETKQGILHLLATEAIINTRLHGDFTCLHTAYESWSPLLPHETVLSVLGFLGVSKAGITFFKEFLQAPLKFMDDTGSPRLRCRGIPGSHALSDVFTELILFCLDFSINQATDGGLVYRVYDDIWFWSPDYSKCTKAWASIQEFTKVIGAELSAAKTGSARLTKDHHMEGIADELPVGDIRWGFLRLSPSSGRFVIDEAAVKTHVEELRKQLQSKSGSVIGWIQAWNSFAATFFSANFGTTTNCFGQEHVNAVLTVHRNIQQEVFEGGNVVQFIKEQIRARFGVVDVPDGFLFFPPELGGLDLASPFVRLTQITESVVKDPYSLMDEFFDKLREKYDAAKNRFDSGEIEAERKTKYKPTDSGDAFMSFEEFSLYAEVYTFGGLNLATVYTQLLQKPTIQGVELSVTIQKALDQLTGQENLRGITADVSAMDAYWKWVVHLYGPEMLDRFGGLNIVDRGLLPIGMVGMFRQKRVKWQG